MTVSNTDAFPPRETREALWAHAIGRAEDLVDAMPGRSPSPVLDQREIRSRLKAFDFESPWPATEAVDDIVDLLANGMAQMQHPRYFGLYNPAPTFPGVLADAITAVLNPQLAVWSSAPAAVEMERHVIAAICGWLGLDAASAGGHFTTGGAEANHTAVLLALTRAGDGYRERGVAALPGAPRVYASAESHLAWFKIAQHCGIGREAVRLVPTDGRGQMCPRALRQVMREDMAGGCVPVMVAATAGTTNAGMIDPLGPIHEVARECGAWLHVDAAWGGAVSACPELVGMLEGIEQADSITIDAHKWLSVPMGAGMILARDRSHFGAAFAVETDYMPEGIEGLDPYAQTIQWSRRFIGLKLFLSLAVLGRGGYASLIRRSVGLARELCGKLESGGWTVVNDPSMAVVCFTDGDAGFDASRIVRHVLGSGVAWVSETRFEGAPVIRACITNFRTDEDDLDLLVRALEEARCA